MRNQQDPAQGAFHRYLDRSHFGDLDGLRCLCIAMVLWHHANPLLGQGPQLAQRGFMGVDFFFVLSGFLITTLLLRERRRRGRFSLAGFYWRRVLRILPPYYLLVTVACVYFVAVKGMHELAPLVPAYYLFLANFLPQDVPLLSVTWSLSVEEQYYALWPLLLGLLSPRLVAPVLVGLIALNVAAGAGVFGIAPLSVPPLLLMLPTSTYAPILMGSLAAWMLDRPGGYRLLRRLTGWTGAAAVMLAALVAALALTPENVNGWPNLLIHTLMTLVLVALVVDADSALSPLLRRAAVARVGQVSYGVYLYHLVALHFVTAGLHRLGVDSMWATLPLYSLLAVAMAEISFRYYESWFLKLRRKPAEAVGAARGDGPAVIPVRPAALSTSPERRAAPGSPQASCGSPETGP